MVPIGGGGLAAGMALALKENNPRVRIVGVQSENIAGMKASLEAGRIVTVPGTTIADGIAVARPGEHNFPIVQKYVDEIVTVSEEEIADAILVLIESEKTVTEGSGAAGVAAVLNNKVAGIAGKQVCVVLTGGNIDTTFLAKILERGLAKEGRLAKFRIIATWAGQLIRRESRAEPHAADGSHHAGRRARSARPSASTAPCGALLPVRGRGRDPARDSDLAAAPADVFRDPRRDHADADRRAVERARVERREDAGYGPIGFFEFAVAGVPMLLGTVGDHPAVRRRSCCRNAAAIRLPADFSAHAQTLVEHYRIEDGAHRLRVRSTSPYVGAPRSEVDLRDYPEVEPRRGPGRRRRRAARSGRRSPRATCSSCAATRRRWGGSRPTSTSPSKCGGRRNGNGRGNTVQSRLRARRGSDPAALQARSDRRCSLV